MQSELEIECRAILAQHLNSVTAQLILVLQRIIGSELPEAAASLRFEYESPHFDDGFPVMYWFNDKRGFPISVQEVLPDIDHTIPESVIYDPRYELAGLNTWALASELFVDWFADCWRDAGGLYFRLPACLAHHDSLYAFDLILRRRIELTD